jgi:Tfp pilus assembly protein PilV
MIVLVFGVIAIANLILVAATSNMVANHATAAVTVANEEMETLKALPFATVAAMNQNTRTVTTTSIAGGAAPRERVTTIQVDTTVRPVAGVGLHIIVVATPINAFNARAYAAGGDPDNPPPTRSQAVFTTFRTME